MKRGKFSRLVWKKFPEPTPERPREEPRIAEVSFETMRVQVAREIGFPLAERPTNSPKTQAIELLKAAAEVEHSLLTQYLYAGYSIDPTSPLAGLRETLLTIALEEMGHLL